jgi:two-component system, NarL family, sensor histidine kinase UhpB
MLNCKPISVLILAWLLFLPSCLFSQTKEDQIVFWEKVLEADHDTTRALALLDYGGLFCYTNYDSAEFYYKQSRDISARNNFYRGMQKYISYQSEIYNLQGLFDINLIHCRRGVDLAIQKTDPHYQGVHLSNIGNIHLFKGNADSAAWYLVSASRLLEEARDSMILGQVYANLSTVFDNIGQYDQALFYNRQALRLAKSNGDHVGIGFAMNNIGVALKKKNQLDSTEYYFKEALAIARQYKQKDLEIDASINLGYTEINKLNYSAAQQFFERAMRLSVEMQHEYGTVNAKKGLAINYMKQQNFVLAENLLKESIQVALRKNFKSELKELYQLQYVAAKANGNYLLALEAYQNHIHFKDSLSNLEIQKNIASLEKQYQAERKEKMLLQKDQQIKSQQTLLQSKNTWIWILGSGMFLLGLIIFLAVKVFKEKRVAEQRQQELLNVQLSMQAKEEERNRIARELHDDLGGSLSGIVVQTHFMRQQVEHHNVTALQKSIEKISQASSEMIIKLNDIIWLVNPNYDTLEKLVQRIEEFANDMAKAKGMDVRIDTTENNESLALNSQARKNIYLICKEAINNAVKYSQATELYLNIARSGDELKLLIEDNGKGFDTSDTRSGNGLDNMKERASNIGAFYSIGKGKKNGTRISLHYNIPQ